MVVKVVEQVAEPVQPQPNIGASWADHDPFHKRPHDPGLLYREHLVPERFRRPQHLQHLVFGYRLR